VLKVMILERTIEEVENRPAARLPVPGLPNLYALLLATVIFVVGIFWDPLAAASTENGVDRNFGGPFHHEPSAAQANQVHAQRGDRP
jgi:hypothetical protein